MVKFIIRQWIRLHGGYLGRLNRGIMTVEEKRQLELKTMRQIIGIYCHDKHHTPKGQLCEDCEEVWQYAQYHRIDVCPHMEYKTFCSVCKTHCYAPTYRGKNKIMRYGALGCYYTSNSVVRRMYLEWKDRKRGAIYLENCMIVRTGNICSVDGFTILYI